MASPLNKFKILVVDADHHLIDITKTMLNGMGFPNVTVTNSASEAFEQMRSTSYDFVITDWHLKTGNGLELLRNIRHGRDSPNPTLPVLMLTGRMEQADVHAARDSGVHEYVLKPVTTQSLFSRLERVVEFPRHFIVAPNYIGPDRRRQNDPVAQELRQKALPAQSAPIDYAQMLDPNAPPQIWMPDFSLKNKLGRNVRLDSIITPVVLRQTQTQVQAAGRLLLEWIYKDIAELKALVKQAPSHADPAAISHQLAVLSLGISTRGGTFGYKRAGEVAYLLYLFFRNQFQPKLEAHYVAIEKHIQVLLFIFDAHILDEEGDIMNLIQELKNLTIKLAIKHAI